MLRNTTEPNSNKKISSSPGWLGFEAISDGHANYKFPEAVGGIFSRIESLGTKPERQQHFCENDEAVIKSKKDALRFCYPTLQINLSKSSGGG